MGIKNIFSLSNLTLVTALTLSAIAAWYSILGLTAIFAAAVIPIIVMGSSLEVAKIVTTVWLHTYWDKVTWVYRLYLVPAVLVLAFLTSMGIFGFLSKAHIDQGVPSGDVAAKVSIIDEKIKTQRENIESAKKALEQMNAQVDARLNRGDSENSAERAVSIRKQQAKERSGLQQEIIVAQKEIAKLSEERAPIASQLRKIEAEVGPIKYIAALIYGDNPDQTVLERAVRWVIIMIVFVFDPLALTLVIASNTSRNWERSHQEPKEETPVVQKPIEPVVTEEPKTEPEPAQKEEPKIEETVVATIAPVIQEPVTTIEPTIEPTTEPTVEPTIAPTVEPTVEPVKTQQPIKKEKPYKELGNNYVLHEGKAIHINALKELKPEYFMLTADSMSQTTTNFGTEFPRTANEGEVFVRVDILPNKVFKFTGNKWIEINKEKADTYLYDKSYIQYLISKIDSGEYDVELLSENEKLQISNYLKSQNN